MILFFDFRIVPKVCYFLFFILSLLFIKIDNPLTTHRNFAYVLNSFIIYRYIIYTQKNLYTGNIDICQNNVLF